jgi:hypothetical protein
MSVPAFEEGGIPVGDAAFQANGLACLGDVEELPRLNGELPK